MFDGEAAGALGAADEALRRDPQHLPAIFNRAMALMQLGDDARALEAIDRVLAIDPALESATRVKATLLARRKP